jgi:hypothetical protein
VQQGSETSSAREPLHANLAIVSPSCTNAQRGCWLLWVYLNWHRVADAVATLLRTAWKAPRDGATEEEEESTSEPIVHSLPLHAQDAALMGSMNFWDILSGKYNSRVPTMNACQKHSCGNSWAAWDPCSKYRSRCCYH